MFILVHTPGVYYGYYSPTHQVYIMVIIVHTPGVYYGYYSPTHKVYIMFFIVSHTWCILWLL